MVIQAYHANCTACGKSLDSASRMADGKIDDELMPSPGDITICLQCGHIMAFAEELKLRDLTDEEAISVAGDPDVLSIQRMRSQLKWD